MKNEYSPAPWSHRREAMSHTPGPYEIDAREDSDWIFIQTAIGGVEVARVEADYWSRSSHHQKLASANARLLAAAPELLAALEGLIDTLGPAYTQDTAGRPWITAALFAVARAKGGG